MLETLFTVNLCLCLLVGFYYGHTESENSLNYFIGYMLAMMFVSVVQNYTDNLELALNLNVTAIAIFAYVIVYKTAKLIMANTQKPHLG